MTKVGRNDPCPCGSKKKFKKCCLSSHQEDERALRNKQRIDREIALESLKNMIPPEAFCDDDLIDEYSNRVVDFIQAGDLDGAESACQALEEKFPYFIDCPDRRAMLCEARGEFEEAIAYNERCLEMIAAAPEGTYETAFIYEESIARLRKSIDQVSQKNE